MKRRSALFRCVLRAESNGVHGLVKSEAPIGRPSFLCLATSKERTLISKTDSCAGKDTFNNGMLTLTAPIPSDLFRHSRRPKQTDHAPQDTRRHPMKTIWKYTLASEAGWQEVIIPSDARILCIADKNNFPTLWIEVDTETVKTTRVFQVYGTGDPIGHNHECIYLGSAIGSHYVWHVYEIL